MSQLDRKIALVTGGSKGLGASTARLFAENGAQVIIADIDDDSGRELAASIGGTYVHCDVASRSDWQSIGHRFETIDILMNNAGILHQSSIIDHQTEDWDRVIAVNQTSVFLGMREIGRKMKNQEHGSIINVSSVAYPQSRPSTVAYTATKYAVIGMTRVAAKELGPYGIRVNALLPGMMDTPMIDKIDPDRSARDRMIKDVPLRRTASSNEIAKMALFLASEESSFCTGEALRIDGGSAC